MTVRKLVLAVLFISATFGLSAQDAAAPAGGAYRSFTPADQWELGVHAGVPFVSGDLDSKLGFGGGLHVRKSLDHIFSIRVSALYAKAKNEGTANPTPTNDLSWFSGSGQLVVALNNLRFDKPNRKILVNVFAGLGVTSFKSDWENIQQVDPTMHPASGDRSDDKFTSAFMEVGAGLAFRVSPKFNIGIEHSISSVFGAGSDMLDGSNNLDSRVTTFRDFFHYPHLTLNFNLGGTDKKSGAKKSEPLYWANPMQQVSDAIAALEARPVYDPTDTDGDGIIDMIDQEKESPAGARVDSKGVTLDSDMDKVPNYKDKEPYSPPGYPVDANGVAQVPKPITENDVNRIVDAKIAAIKFPVQKMDWFMPIINFKLNSYDIEYSEYEKLYQVAQVMKTQPEIRVTVTGNTDQSGPEKYNEVLSYNRAKAAIEFLVNQYGIARERLVLDWAGEVNTLVPVKGATQLNRRAEFRSAKAGEVDKARPEGPEAGKGRFMGNKASGF